MVSTGPLRRALLIVAVALAAVFTSAGPALADPDSSGGYGFNDACEQIAEGLDGIGIQIPGLPTLGDLGGTACKAGNVATHPGQAVEAIKDKAWDSTFGKAVDALLTGLGDAITMSLTWWTRIPTTNTINSPSLFAEIRSYTFQAQILLLAASLIACAIRLGIAHRSGAAEQGTETARVLGRAVFASAMFSTMLTLGTQAGDRFAEWVIDESTDHNAKGVAEAMLQTSTLTALSPGLVFIIATIGMLGAIMQAVFAVVREALLVVVVGILPLAAAGSGTNIGRGFHDRLLAWSVAFVLYKPVAALVYMIAFTTCGKAGSSANDTIQAGQTPSAEQAQQVLVGVVLLCSAALVLPALMRLVTPLSSIGGGMSGAVAAAGLIGTAASLSSMRGTGAKATAGAGGGRPGGGPGPRGGNTGGGSGSGARPV
ncbi:hypothetical protein, partial [Nocardia yamanashiensis]|uniref:hypothetical protein n=1 Tax=Nocardia yamanashiensis TaxID=209247 RepID=UPI000A693616